MIWIRGAGDYCDSVGEELPPLKALVQEVAGGQVRRVGRFIRLALIGAARCAGNRWPDPATAVYLSSARGDLETTLEVVETLFRQGLPPMPLSFVNTVSNAPCYYVARHFGLAGRSNFVCNRSTPLESVLELAALDLELGHMGSALVGSVDVATSPVADHRKRLGLGEVDPVAEGSHWLWLQAGNAPSDAIGELVAARGFTDREALIEWLSGLGLPGADCQIGAGPFAAADDIAAIQAAAGIAGRFRAPSPPGYYDSQSGAAINAFLRRGAVPYLVHVNGEVDGRRRTAVVVRRTPAA